MIAGQAGLFCRSYFVLRSLIIAGTNLRDGYKEIPYPAFTKQGIPILIYQHFIDTPLGVFWSW
jgi:hypothetical protein